MHKTISSLQNPLVKQCVLLSEKSRERKRSGQFVIEGQREIQLALIGGYEIKTLFYCSAITSEEILSEFENNSIEIIEISKDVYDKLAYRKTTEGLIAIATMKELGIDKLIINNKAPLILVAEAPEKPGNIGALLRTADAANVDAVIIANPKTDLYNPNIIRSSVGCLFTNQLAIGATAEIISFLKDENINIYCAALEASVEYHNCDFTEPAAIVVGTESTGLSEEWLENSTQNIIIPMQGEIDSMNLSVAVGILIFEAKRQRSFN